MCPCQLPLSFPWDYRRTCSFGLVTFSRITSPHRHHPARTATHWGTAEEVAWAIPCHTNSSLELLWPHTSAHILLVPQHAPQLPAQSTRSITPCFSSRHLLLPKHSPLVALCPSPHAPRTTTKKKFTISAPQRCEVFHDKVKPYLFPITTCCTTCRNQTSPTAWNTDLQKVFMFPSEVFHVSLSPFCRTCALPCHSGERKARQLLLQLVWHHLLIRQGDVSSAAAAAQGMPLQEGMQAR